MSYSLYPTDPDVRSVSRPLQRSGAIGRKIGSGSFSVVYDTPMPSSVYKITTCKANVDYLTAAYSHVRRGDRHLMRMNRFDGEVGRSASGDTIYGMWVERLRPMYKRKPCDAEARRLADILVRIFSTNGLRATINEHVGNRLPTSLIASLETLHAITSSMPDAQFDLWEQNIMIRPSTGELVISDPVMMTDCCGEN